MKMYSLTFAAAALGLAPVHSPNANLHAAELQVLAGGGMTAPLKDLTTQFEADSGHKLVIRFGTTPELIKLTTSGGPFDLAVVPREVFKDAAAQAQFVSGPTIDIARVGLGVAVRSGAPKPDIGTPEAFKQRCLKRNPLLPFRQARLGRRSLGLSSVSASARS